MLPGVRRMDDLEDLLSYFDATDEERDYGLLDSLVPDAGAKASGVYCNHCQPCPAGLEIGLINKYHDLAHPGDALARPMPGAPRPTCTARRAPA